MIVKRKPKIRIMKDGRVILSGSAYRQMKAKLRELADNHCEVCGRYDSHGDPDHVVIRGLGGGKRDDRIFINGKRNLFYKCRLCHNHRHVPDKVVPAKPTNAEFDALLGLEEEQS